MRYRELLRKVAKRLASRANESLPYMEPRYWYYPVRQSLAVALMQAGRLDEAEEQFQRVWHRRRLSRYACRGVIGNGAGFIA